MHARPFLGEAGGTFLFLASTAKDKNPDCFSPSPHGRLKCHSERNVGFQLVLPPPPNNPHHSNLLVWTKRGNIWQHMSPSVNKHFQHVEKNNLAWRSPPSGCDEPAHLSQPLALFLAAAETVSTRQLFKEPHIKGGKVERLASYFSILAPTSYKSSTANLLPPRVRFFHLPLPHLPKITRSQLKRPCWRMFDVSEHARDVPSANLIR